MSASGAVNSTHTLLSARWVIGHANGEHCVYEHAEVVFCGNHIVHVGHGYTGPVDKRLDYGEAIISPGFIDLDALSDLDTTILSYDNASPASTGRVWPRSYVEKGPFEMYSAEELAFQKHFAFSQLIRNGITTALPIASLFYRAWGETVAEFESAARSADALGLRVYLGPAYRTGNQVVESNGQVVAEFDEERGLAELEAAAAFAQRMEDNDSPLLRGMLAPDRIETCTAELLKRTSETAKRLNVPVRLHCCQSSTELALIQQMHGSTPIEWLDKLNFLSDGCLLPHGVHMTDTDIELAVEAGVTVVHCPLVSARHGSTLDSFMSYKARGMKLAMGTDTWPPDMIQNLQQGVIMNRAADSAGVESCRSESLFDAATLGGATALKRPDLGKLESGACADIIVIKLDRSLCGPDPVQSLMTGCSGRDVSNVFIHGRHVLVDGEIPGVDNDADWVQAQQQFDKIISLYPERTLNHPPVDDIFSTSYPRAE
ncbi:chlorohydrolase family protein [Granulosicoccus antarcticus]|uniref:8-oxoguanine deaminase n=1 Tax=Granulosicoccus antarcticus IMCC3135 TaxID=1192854 RepID=A0A2Z2P1Q7_9GAMM|nr:chlorohydrolase family protein [Granulosicoccus antarcticus]ASJ76168.1 8-oxoguanine deaminase [Granulosicoccus antarcticus IMCC3135]